MELAMSAKLEEIRKKIARLEKEAEELQRLKSDCDDAKKFRKLLVEENSD